MTSVRVPLAVWTSMCHSRPIGLISDRGKKRKRAVGTMLQNREGSERILHSTPKAGRAALPRVPKVEGRSGRTARGSVTEKGNSLSTIPLCPLLRVPVAYAGAGFPPVIAENRLHGFAGGLFSAAGLHCQTLDPPAAFSWQASDIRRIQQHRRFPSRRLLTSGP